MLYFNGEKYTQAFLLPGHLYKITKLFLFYTFLELPRPPTEVAESMKVKKLWIYDSFDMESLLPKFCNDIFNSLKMASLSVKNVRFSDISMSK